MSLESGTYIIYSFMSYTRVGTSADDTGAGNTGAGDTGAGDSDTTQMPFSIKPISLLTSDTSSEDPKVSSCISLKSQMFIALTPIVGN
jgi:hypothetical protein